MDERGDEPRSDVGYDGDIGDSLPKSNAVDNWESGCHLTSLHYEINPLHCLDIQW